MSRRGERTMEERGETRRMAVKRMAVVEDGIRSSSVDSAMFDGLDDSTEEIDETDEHSFEETNDDNPSRESTCKSMRSRLVRYGSKRLPILQFSPKVVYDRCAEAENLGEKCHLTFKFVKNESKLIRNILEGHGFREVHPSSSEFNLLWTGGGMKPFTLRSLQPFQRVNHFPRSYEMTRKDRLYKNVQKMQQEKGLKNFNFIPTTFLLPYEFEDFSNAFQREKGLWIIKPVASSQGKGIFLINHPDQVPLDENLVISRYVDNPLLIDGYKFDVRIYVAVTSYDPLVAYLYEEGLTRFATVKYDPHSRSIKNAFMHLTNYSVNKRSHRYVRCDDPEIEDFGNKWSMSAMLRLLKSEGKDTFSLMMAIEDVVIKTLLSVESQISAACRMFVPTRGNCFEVYGFDILIDDELRPWVLEVNLSPSLACDAPIDLKIKSHMICDLLNLCSFPCTDPSLSSAKQRQQQQQKSESNEQLKKRRPISAGYSLSSSLSSGVVRSGRAKTASRTLSHSRERPAEDVVHPRGEYFGLSSEEIRILRTIREENRQRGGFVRIFPTSDTYEYFSMFFEQRTTSFNQMIHQRLYPSRWAPNSLLSNPPNSSSQVLRRTTIPRSKHLSVSFQQQSSNEKEKINGSDLHEALQRYQIYQRRLLDLVSPPSGGGHQHLPPSLEDKPPTSKLKPTIEASVAPKPKRLTTKPVDEGRHSIYSKNDLIEMFNQGLTLSPKQARTAFGTYLERIQIRLMLDSELKEDVTSSQHMELVLRFLKRAGLNLSPVFRVEIPSRRLSIADQKRILAKQLADFLHLYNKETLIANPTSNSIDAKLFETFLRSANEADLEQIMTTYMKTNHQSSIHLGVHPKANHKPPITSTNNNNDSIHSSDLPQDKSETTSIEVKPVTRASSASRQRTLPQQQRRQDEIYRVYGITRPLSAVVQHRKQLTATGSSVPGAKLLTRERPNSANLPGEQNHSSIPSLDTNKDFVEQLNELSSKQHRRQYSAVHHLNVLPSRSLSVEGNAGGASSEVDSTSSKRDLSKEEEILEKSRQMIEESQAKNELLAEQAKVFQRTLQRNEIYSALNRYSHRPPIYPSVLKENRTSTNQRFPPQARPTSTFTVLSDHPIHRVKSNTTTNSSQD